MPLIAINSVTEQLNSSSVNLNIIIGLNKPTPEEVVTEVSLACIDVIKKSHLGMTHATKKFLATSLTYTSMLALPVAVLAGTVWRVSSSLKELQELLVPTTVCGALLLADLAIGKVFGIRPLTAISIASYDAYRQAALTLSKQVRDSYTNQEKQTQSQIEKHQQTIKNQLIATYAGIASELATRHKQGALKEEIKILATKLPLVSNALSKIGLTHVEIAEILSPLKDTIKLIKFRPSLA